MRDRADEVARAVEVLRLLADPTRLRILVLLQGAELTVGELARELGRAVPAVSQHLAKLRAAGVVERTVLPDGGRPHEPGRARTRRSVRLTVDVPAHFALNQPLSPFAFAALDLLDPADPAHPHDVVSVIEATLEDPRAIVRAQEHKARGEAIGAMKAEGIEYDERMALLEDETWPKPLADLLEAVLGAVIETADEGADGRFANGQQGLAGWAARCLSASVFPSA